MKKFHIILIAIFITSCAGAQKKAPQPAAGSLESENQILRKRIVAVERQNSVIEDENNKLRKDSRDRKAQIEKLSSDIKALNEKYNNEIILWTQKYDNILKQNEILGKESSEKIKELTDLNKKIETDLGAQIKRLNDEMNAKEKAAAKLLETEKKAFSAREYQLSSEIEKHKKEISARDEKILNLDSTVRTLTVKADDLEKDKKIAQASIKKSEADYERLTRENEKLKSSSDQNELKIKELENEIVKLKSQMSAPGGGN